MGSRKTPSQDVFTQPLLPPQIPDFWFNLHTRRQVISFKRMKSLVRINKRNWKSFRGDYIWGNEYRRNKQVAAPQCHTALWVWWTSPIVHSQGPPWVFWVFAVFKYQSDWRPHRGSAFAWDLPPPTCESRTPVNQTPPPGGHPVTSRTQRTCIPA